MSDARKIIYWMLDQGYLVYHPDDLDKREEDRRLLKTEKGEIHQRQIEAREEQRRKAHLS